MAFSSAINTLHPGGTPKSSNVEFSGIISHEYNNVKSSQLSTFFLLPVVIHSPLPQPFSQSLLLTSRHFSFTSAFMRYRQPSKKNARCSKSFLGCTHGIPGALKRVTTKNDAVLTATTLTFEQKVAFVGRRDFLEHFRLVFRSYLFVLFAVPRAFSSRRVLLKSRVFAVARRVVPGFAFSSSFCRRRLSRRRHLVSGASWFFFRSSSSNVFPFSLTFFFVRSPRSKKKRYKYKEKRYTTQRESDTLTSSQTRRRRRRAKRKASRTRT